MTDIVRDGFFIIGFGFLVLALRLAMIRYIIRREGEVPPSASNEQTTTGIGITIIGLLVVILGLVRGWSSTEGIVMLTAGGGTATVLGLSWVLQGIVQSGRVAIRVVSRLTILTAIIGVVLIALYLNEAY
jgi:hypothetical protein